MQSNKPDTTEKLLLSYEQAINQRDGINGLYYKLLGTCLLVFLGLTLSLLAVDLPPLIQKHQAERRASFLVEEPEPIPVVAETLEPEVIEDLTQRPELGHEESVPTEIPQVAVVEAPEPEPAPRRVYGVRKVFAKGLGGSGSSAGAVVSKYGNTLNKEPDEWVATEEELTGTLAPLSSVTSPPVLIGRVRPEYSPEMIANRVSGLVRARLLVDVDGTVKAVDVMEDIGFGSREAAIDGFRQLRFEPARRGEDPVAVWIIMKYRFELQE